MSAKPRIQVFLPKLSDEKAAETARRMPFLKKEFKVGVTHLGSSSEDVGFFQDSGIPLTAVKAAPLPPDDLMNYISAFAEILEEDTPDIAMAALPGPESAAFVVAAKNAGVPLVAVEFDDQLCLLSCFEELAALHFCDVILPANRTLQRSLLKVLPGLSSRVGHLLPYSADTTYVQQCREDRRRLRQQLQVDPELKMITMIAPFDRRRDYDTLLEACALLKKRGYNFVLLLVGNGPERRRIAEKVKQLRLQEQTTIMDDPGDHTDILCATDIFALSIHFEGNSVPLLEAMALGLAIAATNVPGVNDLIRDQRSGRLAEWKNPESFALALADLFAQEKTRKKLGSVARKCVENRNNLNRFMPQLISTLKNKYQAALQPVPHMTPAEIIGLEHLYVGLQIRIREFWREIHAEADLSETVRQLDQFPIYVQVDFLEKLSNLPLDPETMLLYIRPLENILPENLFEPFPLLEMRLFEKLSDFYIQLNYREGVEKMIEEMGRRITSELFEYHFATNRFAGLRSHVKLARLYDFVHQRDPRDYFRLELREFLRPALDPGNPYFHLQNAAFLEGLGENKLAMRELQKESPGTLKLTLESADKIPYWEEITIWDDSES
ncbi:MAG: glycosyltransferase, partial [bacterium]